jgi:hypothetical protein
MIRSGIVINSHQIRNEFGHTIKYLNSLPKCTIIWIHYDKNGNILSIEPKVVGSSGTVY